MPYESLNRTAEQGKTGGDPRLSVQYLVDSVSEVGGYSGRGTLRPISSIVGVSLSFVSWRSFCFILLSFIGMSLPPRSLIAFYLLSVFLPIPLAILGMRFAVSGLPLDKASLTGLAKPSLTITNVVIKLGLVFFLLAVLANYEHGLTYPWSLECRAAKIS